MKENCCTVTPSMNTSDILEVSKSPIFLLVEDNKIALFTLERLVAQIGCQFISVMDGEAAFSLVQKNKFDLIITDFGLPGLSGIDLTSEIRAFEKENQVPLTPIIGLTAYREEKIKHACRESGMNEVVTKPMTVELLSMFIKKYLPETFIASLRLLEDALILNELIY